MPIPALPTLATLNAPTNSNSVSTSGDNNVSSNSADSFAQALTDASNDTTSNDTQSQASTQSSQSDTQTRDTTSKTSTKTTSKSDDHKATKTSSKDKDSKDTKTKGKDDKDAKADTKSDAVVVAAPVVPTAPVAATPTVVLPTDAQAALAAQATVVDSNAVPAAPIDLTKTVAAALAPTAVTAVDTKIDPKAQVAPVDPKTLTATVATDKAPITEKAAPEDYTTAVVATIADQVKDKLPDATAKDALPTVVAPTTPTVDPTLAAQAATAAAQLPQPELQPTVVASTAVADNATLTTNTPAPSSPYSQVVSIIQPLLKSSEGAYNLTLQLHPQDMGKVNVAVTMHDGQISMQLSADNPDSRQMLRDSMDDLRQQLESEGVSTGSLDVSTGDTNQQEQAGQSSNSNKVVDTEELDDNDFFARLATVPSASTRTADGAFDARV